MGLQRLLTLGGFALVVCVGYLVLSIGLMMAAGLDPLHLSVGGVLMTFGATCVYALMTVACGFMLSEFGLSEEAANGFANIFGLLIMFTSGVALPIDMMPGVMVTIAKFLPGWWYCTAIDNALGFGTAAETGISVAGWSGSLGLVALFGVMFICIGLAARPLPPIPPRPGRARHHAAGRVRNQPFNRYRCAGSSANLTRATRPSFISSRIPDVAASGVNCSSRMISLTLMAECRSSTVIIALTTSPGELFAIVRCLVMVIVNVLMSLRVVAGSMPASRNAAAMRW